MRLSIDIPDDLHREVRVKAINEGTTVTAVVKGLLEGYVGARPSAGAPTELVRALPAAHERPARPISKSDQARGRTR